MKARARSHFVCQECGAESVRWLGRCPECAAWNSLVEEAVAPPAGAAGSGARGAWHSGGQGAAPAEPRRLAEVEAPAGERSASGLAELDRVLGGGMVAGSLVLLGGDPGIGKSTLLLQVCNHVAGAAPGATPASSHGAGTRVLYVTGEESAAQVKLRADRLGGAPDELYILPETDLSLIEQAVERLQPGLVVADSVQTVFSPGVESAPGSVSQVRECAAAFMRLAKSRGITTFLVGHINKEGALAGPKVLEHMVDVVLYLEGERHHAYRILRGVKNRFGPTSEIGVFTMGEAGLEEVANPSELFLAERPAGVAGSVVVAGMEGSRPVLVEVQALLSGPNPATPRRTVAGIDHNRLALLLAVLEKRAGLGLGSYDAYVKVVGGLRLDEPAADLGVVLALASAFRERPVDARAAVAGEVGLGGEVRAVARIEARLAEAARLGFARVILPERSRRAVARSGGPGGPPGSGGPPGLELVGVEDVAGAISAALL